VTLSYLIVTERASKKNNAYSKTIGARRRGAWRLHDVPRRLNPPKDLPKELARIAGVLLVLGRGRELLMLKTKTYYEQVSLEIVKRVSATHPRVRKAGQGLRVFKSAKKPSGSWNQKLKS
jgi:hypothetical protein